MGTGGCPEAPVPEGFPESVPRTPTVCSGSCRSRQLRARPCNEGSEGSRYRGSPCADPLLRPSTLQLDDAEDASGRTGAAEFCSPGLVLGTVSGEARRPQAWATPRLGNRGPGWCRDRRRPFKDRVGRLFTF